jgi:uncharacterized glyoxalase superfamily protein PhnB
MVTRTTHEQRIVPYLGYEDGPAALDFLTRVFGFNERVRELRPDGTLMHGEVEYQGNVVMLGTPVDESGSPLPLRHGPLKASLMCYVDDLDDHYARVKSSGAKIVSELKDKSYGHRMYAAEDTEGNHWYFSAFQTDSK